MALMKLFKKAADPYPGLSHERKIPYTDIISTQAFIQAKSFRGYRREKISSYGLDGVERNERYFCDNGADLTGSRIDLMVVKADNDIKKCIRILVDGKFLGNIYRSDTNREYFNKIVKQQIDGAYVKLDTVTIDGRTQVASSYLMVHWPGIGPRVTIE